jgi:hypothetical protein
MEISIKNHWLLKHRVKKLILFSLSFFVGKTIGDKEFDLAAKEGTFVFHTVARNQSFQSMDCTSTIIQKLFEPKFTCAQTKV